MRPAITAAYFRSQRLPAMKLWRQYEEQQWWEPERLVEHQRQLLQRQLRLASSSVPYYRDFGSTDSIDSFPIIARRTLQEGRERLLSQGVKTRGVYTSNSSGSTGQMVHVACDEPERLSRLASTWRGDSFGGLNPWSRTISLWGTSQRSLDRQGLRRRIKNWLFNLSFLDSLSLDEKRVRQYHAFISREKPRRIIGYVHALRQFSRIALALGLEPLETEKVIPGAEELDMQSEQLIRQMFRGELMPRYGCREAGDLAHVCEKGNWHIHSDHVYLEVLRSDGSIGTDGRGELLITKLHNNVMPLVRYSVGDVATLGGSPCTCGRALPLMSGIEGRVSSHIILPDGTSVSPFVATLPLYGDELDDFQLIQEDEANCTILVVPHGEWSDELSQRMKHGLEQWFRQQLSVRVEIVSEIPLSAGGKRMLCINRLSAAQ